MDIRPSPRPISICAFYPRVSESTRRAKLMTTALVISTLFRLWDWPYADFLPCLSLLTNREVGQAFYRHDQRGVIQVGAAMCGTGGEHLLCDRGVRERQVQ